MNPTLFPRFSGLSIAPLGLSRLPGVPGRRSHYRSSSQAGAGHWWAFQAPPPTRPQGEVERITRGRSEAEFFFLEVVLPKTEVSTLKETPHIHVIGNSDFLTFEKSGFHK